MRYTSKEVYEFISRQTNDPIVEWKTCAVSGQPFAIFQSDLDFYAKISPTFAGQKFQIPTPTLCPEERQRRRLSFRNERKLYRRQCDASKKSIISIYSPDKPYKVYDQKIRWSDSRDPLDYGFEFDFSKTFTEQYSELIKKVPRLPLYATQNENSDYLNGAAYNKNCYLIFASDYNENCMFADNSSYCNHSTDLSDTTKSQYSYQLISCNSCNSCDYSIDCRNCDNCSYCFDCRQCKECFLCTSLCNKQYCFQNQQYSKEEYYKLVEKCTQEYNPIQIMSYFINLKKQAIHNSYSGFGNTNTSGNVITNCNNSQNLFSCHEMNHCKNIINGTNCSDCYDSYVIIDNSQLSYQNLSSIGLYQCMSTVCCWNTNYHIYYCDHCQNCQNCFGCIGLRDASYCIFNKQYSKEEYEIQVAKIITHMQSTGERGEFFHPSLSPFGYNETVAQEYYPIQKLGEVGELGKLRLTSLTHPSSLNFGDFGYHRSTYNADPSIPEGVQTIERKNYSDEQRNSLLQENNLETKVFLCSVSSRPYRLQKAEIEFYRKHKLPIPDKHPDIRHEERMRLRPGRTLFLRTCDCCGKEMLSVYAPKEVLLGDPQDHEGKVYCEECYQKEVYS